MNPYQIKEALTLKG